MVQPEACPYDDFDLDIDTPKDIKMLPAACQQVRLLTHFFLFLLCKKIIDLPGGQINDPLSGKHYSLLFLQATPSSPSRTLEGLFELTLRPSPALDSPHTLLPELQRYKYTVRCAALGEENP